MLLQRLLSQISQISQIPQIPPTYNRDLIEICEMNYQPCHLKLKSAKSAKSARAIQPYRLQNFVIS